MSSYNPTIVAASLSDEELQKSINSLVNKVKEGTDKMKKDMTDAVAEMKKQLQSLGNVNITTGNAPDGGSSRRTKEQNQEAKAVKETAVSYKQLAEAQQVAIRNSSPNSVRNADTLQTMNIQLDLLRERLREARQQYSSFVALSAHATTTGDKGLFQYATDGVHRYEQEVKSLIPQIRSLQAGIQQMGDVIAPQGHTIQNYVNSLQKANPELAALNAQYKSGTSLLQDQSTSYASATQSAQRYTEEIRKQAQAIRESRQWKEKGFALVGDKSYYDPERSSLPAKHRQTLEEQILATMKQEAEQAEAQAKAEAREAEEKRKVQQEAQNQLNVEQQITAEQKKRSQPKSFTSYDDLRQSMAHVLGLQESQIKLANAETASYNNLSNSLKQLKQTYDRLTASERNSDQGKALVASIHEVERAISKIKSQQARPISLRSIIGLDEKTLDDIAYKIQRLQSYKMGLNVNTQVNEMKQVDREIINLKKRYDELMNKNQQMIKSNTALGRSWNYMKNRLAFYFTVGASTQFVKNLIDVRSQYEMNERALGILINSAERGTQIFQELSQMALVSPYTLIELSSAAKQLTAYDIAAKDVVDTTRRLADMASAVGVPMERLTYALGQIKAYGYLNSRDARMFANAGIPLVKQLADYYTQLEGKMVSVGDVYDRMKKKAIDFNSVMAVINNMTDEGGQFFDFQAKMADTLKVRLANLTLAWNNMLNDIGASEQGILTSGIGLLKTFFANWKSINNVLEDVAITFGAVKAAHLAYYAVVLNTNKAIAIETVLGTRLSNIMRNLASTMNTVLTSGATWWGLLAVAAGSAIVEVLRGNEAMKDFNKTLRRNAENTYNDLVKFQEQYSKLRNSLYETRKENGKTVTTPKDIDSDEAKKAWEAVREQIELSSRASDQYIGRLLSIQNVSERLRQGFAVIDSIQNVSAALKELGDDAIKLERDWAGWWNLWTFPDGTIGNLKDAHMWLSKINDEFGSLQNAKALSSTDTLDNGLENLFKDRAAEYVERYEEELARFRNDIETTKQSVIDFINLKGWSGDTNKINEVFKQVTENLVLKNQLDPQQAYTLQLEMENARSKAAKEAQYIRLKDLSDAYAAEKDKQHKEEILQEFEKEKKIYENWSTFNGQSKVEWERFTKWLKEQHISETTAMFRDMDAEQISSLNFQEGNYNDWVVRMVTKYAKEHKMSYDDAFKYLKGWVTSANQWSIYIPLIISTEDKKTVFQQLEEYDKAVDAADEKIARLTKRIGELKKKKKKDKEETKELTDAEKELAAAQKDKADAESKGGHGKKEKKDEKAAEKAARKAAKQSETELQKALKDELSVIEKVRSIYKELTKEGMSHADAVELATEGWDETVNAINRILQKNGLQRLDLAKFVGVANPRELVNMLRSQLDVLVRRGAKPAEIKEFQAKIRTLKVDASKYDLTMITNGLNNELSKLKDEYELAVALDADPELGSMFAEMMGININDLPRTVKEYADLYTKYLNEYLSKTDAGFQLDNLNLTNDSLRALEERVKEGTLTQAAYEAIAKAVQDVRDKRKKDFEETTKEFNALIKKYGEYQAKMEEVRQTADKERLTFVKTYGGEEEIKQAIQLTTEIGAEKDPTKKEQLRQQLITLVNQLAGDDATRLKLKVAIDTQQARGEAGVDFEEFQKSPDWIIATGDLANMTNKAIGGLIDSLEEYKKSAKNLDSKQIKQINNALKSLYKQHRQNNPFGAISDAIDQARENASLYDEKLQEMEDKINDYFSRWEDLTNEEKDALGELIDEYDKLRAKKEEVSKINASAVVSGLNNAISSAKSAASMFGELAEAIGGEKMNDAAKTVKKIVGVLDKAGQGAQIGSAFGGYGAAIGAIIGTIIGFVTEFRDELSGNAGINAEIQYIKEDLIKLNTVYKRLQDEADNSYGWIAISAKKAVIANKELQLEEMKRQLRMEESRKEKDKDYEQIENLKGQIVDLELEIKNASNDIINDLLGISGVGDAMESLMDGFIEALRSGEDAMAVFDESIDDMIVNMVKKMFVTKILQPWFEEQWSKIQNDINSRATHEQQEYDRIANMTDEELAEKLAVERMRAAGIRTHTDEWENSYNKYLKDVTKEDIENYRKAKKAALDNAIIPTTDDIRKYAELLRTGQPVVEESMKEVQAFLEELGLMKNTASDKNLSALQQGIQGITETTAGALEAYMNGVSQQVYLQSTLMMQINETIQSFDIDVQTSTLGDILLQLQNSYQVQQSIQTILNGWSTPSGLAVRVEMN